MDPRSGLVYSGFTQVWSANDLVICCKLSLTYVTELHGEYYQQGINSMAPKKGIVIPNYDFLINSMFNIYSIYTEKNVLFGDLMGDKSTQIQSMTWCLTAQTFTWTYIDWSHWLFGELGQCADWFWPKEATW